MLVEWTRFRGKRGKTQMEKVLLTLEDEKMHVETTLYGEEYLYWYSVQGELI
ncbi:hypothetical protein KP78_03370 [Jeotgalibacillus soli]|uniref:Uncharacterized protein n=1 Tax=Jeotgalibacillus soli TaxID=889306 RepID=A0A0C2VSR5_9BACL|nr:hypothetical protein KP78_03370 [Jeotgalibacillus soli]